MSESVIEILSEIFSDREKGERSNLTGKHLVHYTSAANAMDIIKKGEIWLRNLRVMNDVAEVDHGFQFMHRSIQAGTPDSAAERGLHHLADTLDRIFPNLSSEVVEYNSQFDLLRNHTYVTCLSDRPDSEMDLGRLSMWRNYSANQTGVGIIIKTDLFQTATDRLGIFSTPVAYYTEPELNQRLLNAAAEIRKNRVFLENEAGRDLTKWFYLQLLRTLTIGLKHPGFSEEREWRVFHTLGVDPIAGLDVETETVSGVPQRVVKFRLENAGLKHGDIIAGLLIGPSPYQHIIADGLRDLLLKKDVREEDLEIRLSQIPLRT